MAWQAAGNNSASGAFNDADQATPTLPRNQTLAIAFSAGNSSEARSMGESIEHTPPLRSANSGSNQVPTMAQGASVRRLTPLECERLQGFPDHWTDIEGNSDTQRYRQLGNAVAVPVATWIIARLTL